ncbi:MAG TPA: hypothetical protein VFF04_02425 [Candidatus Babeliales bacterium]|nr:hypothetical protein [Candidatus Babeliales bacterium]
MHLKIFIVLSLCSFANTSFAAEKKMAQQTRPAKKAPQTELRSRDKIDQMWKKQTKEIEQDKAFQTDITERLQRMEEGINTIKAQTALQSQQVSGSNNLKRLFFVVLTAGCAGDCLKGLLF